MRRAALLAVLASGCALPVVSAGTFLPAGDLQQGEVHASVSLEAGRVLAGPSDVPDTQAAVPGSDRWEVSTWVASDASVRWQVFRRVALEAQLKLTNPIEPFAPALVGGALAMRVRLRERRLGEMLAIEVGLRAVGVSVQERLDRTHNGATQTDRWDYRAVGGEVPMIASWRISPLFAVTASPFLRAYWIRVQHSTVHTDGTLTGGTLEWSPVLSGGMGASVALDFGPVEIAPGIAVELATRPGRSAPTHVLFEPGLSVGTRF
jgi:hypothetical protein